jgi:hypothetical protein
MMGGRGVETPVWEGTEVVLREPAIGGAVVDVLIVVGETMAMGRSLVLRRIRLADLHMPPENPAPPSPSIQAMAMEVMANHFGDEQWRRGLVRRSALHPTASTPYQLQAQPSRSEGSHGCNVQMELCLPMPDRMELEKLIS